MPDNILHGTNIHLRMPEPSDVDVLYQWENDLSVWRVSTTVVPFSRFQMEQYVMNSQHDIYSERQLRLMIDLVSVKRSIKTIGCIDLFDFDPQNRRAGIGILIIPEEREKGYAAEALGLLIRYSFEILQVHQLYCNITTGNDQSIRLFTNAGFIQCGVKKEWRIIDGKWSDEIIFQLLGTRQ
jgi:diamine N-acetyltransferase